MKFLIRGMAVTLFILLYSGSSYATIVELADVGDKGYFKDEITGYTGWM